MAPVYTVAHKTCPPMRLRSTPPALRFIKQDHDIAKPSYGEIWRAVTIQVGGYQSHAGRIEKYGLEVTRPLAPSHSNAVTSGSNISRSITVEIGDGSRGKYPRNGIDQTVVCPTYRSLAIAKVHAHYCSRRGPSDAGNVELAVVVEVCDHQRTRLSAVYYRRWPESAVAIPQHDSNPAKHTNCKIHLAVVVEIAGDKRLNARR
jgi:hypothetical protein